MHQTLVISHKELVSRHNKTNTYHKLVWIRNYLVCFVNLLLHIEKLAGVQVAAAGVHQRPVGINMKTG